MEISASFAAQNYARARPATEPSENSFMRAADSFAQTLEQGEQTSAAAMVGGADPHALVQALSASELAVETAVTVRNKVVEAYQEILRMQV
ncbi:flagellar hook-basal body complex protein FliE [Falsirhodobacter sp. alg1]|uniref:flagellar hook-basal body complex protein FliE n=1 Tax=Falsirhodobacter sp. alg1 TaxID=1472418 RepID=UPI0005EE06A2|nr:flagellar hook-basal body complex protein FliE [Falsirhodobacter sp. alg1]